MKTYSKILGKSFSLSNLSISSINIQLQLSQSYSTIYTQYLKIISLICYSAHQNLQVPKNVRYGVIINWTCAPCLPPSLRAPEGGSFFLLWKIGNLSASSNHPRKLVIIFTLFDHFQRWLHHACSLHYYKFIYKF